MFEYQFGPFIKSAHRFMPVFSYQSFVKLGPESILYSSLTIITYICPNILVVQYVRVSNSTDPKVVLEVLTRYWKLQVPKLVIAVTGGKKNFKLNSQDQATFNRGLIKVGIYFV